MHKKIIVSLCAVTLISLGAAAVGPSISANADNTVSTTPTQADDFHGTVNLINEQGQVLGQSSVLNGKIGDHVTVTLPTGYVAVSNGASTIDYVLNKEGTPIKIRKIGDVEVSRTIRLHMPDGSIKTVTQVAKAGETFAQYDVPEVKYYRASTTIVPAEFAKAGHNKIVNIHYNRMYPNWTVGVKGYDVVTSGPITRTINFVDENGKKLASSKVETVNREVLVKKHHVDRIYPNRKVVTPNETVSESSLSTATAQSNLSTAAVRYNNRDKVLGYLVLEVNGHRSNVIAPAYKLQDVKAPTIKGYTLKDKKLANIDGQYLWLSMPETLTNTNNAKLASGLDEFLTKDTTINVVYTKNGKVAAVQGKNGQNSNGQQANNQQNGNAQNGNSAANNNGNTQNASNGGTTGSNTGALPQTGNKPMNWLVMGIASAMSALGLGFLSARKQRS
jgi:LPXTG-motif cell wall-anchored protein